MKSIYGRVKKYADAQPIPIMIHGDKVSAQLHGLTERITNPRIGRIRTTIETLKLSAAYSGSYSLSSNQLGIPNSVFVMHKEILDQQSAAFQDKLWLHPDAYELQELAPMPDLQNDTVSMATANLLDPSDFKTFLNPRLVSETSHNIVDWEYCLSFPGIRCMIKRP